MLLGVVAEAPQFLVLAGPLRVPARAGRLVLRVSSLASAALSVSGRGVRRRRLRLSRRLVALTVRVTPGSGPLRLQLELSSGRLHTTVSMLILR